jgi:polyisoprenoid-binding protein YceI
MRRRTALIVVAAALTLVVAVPLAAYGYLVWTTRDAPERAALDDAPSAPGTGGPTAADGTWTPAGTPTDFVGYRVRERVGPVSAPSDAVGRAHRVRGTLTIDGERLRSLEVTVNMRDLRSDSSSRDDILRDESLETDRFPRARFVLRDAVDLGAPRRGRVIEARVPGELTVRDVTREVVFDVQARWNGPTIQAAGSTEIERSDFGVETGGLAGFNVGETATIEFELTFAPQGARIEGATPGTLVDNPETATASDDVVPCQSDGSAPPLASPVLMTSTSSNAALVVAGLNQTSPVYVSTGRLAGAAWSPDGTQVVVASSPTLEAEPSLATVGTAGGPATALPDLGDVGQPDWGPDGEIVFVTEEPDGDSDIWIAAADGSRARRLVATEGADRDPRWSPDGRWIAFATLRGTQNQDVMIVRADGSDLRAVASTTGYEYAPSFTPDGGTVLFVRDGAIRQIGLGDEHSRALTDGPNDANPALSPDGNQLAFVRAGSLYVADRDGSQPTCIQTGEAMGGGPRWLPLAG